MQENEEVVVVSYEGSALHKTAVRILTAKNPSEYIIEFIAIVYAAIKTKIMPEDANQLIHAILTAGVESKLGEKTLRLIQVAVENIEKQAKTAE